MSKKLDADASPEKRLFISLITRDIPLVAAFLDLVDNSVNATLEQYADRLETAQDYVAIFNDAAVTPNVDIDITISKDRIEIKDTASGISATTAQDHIFKFGRSSGEAHEGDRLSVYGIGLKRAIFKMGNKISIRSDHMDGGFDLKLNVSEWEKDQTLPWKMAITTRDAAHSPKTGTTIVITDLYEETQRRVDDGVFIGELQEAIARTYAYYLAKFVRISVNKTPIQGVSMEIGANHESDEFTSGAVSCAITAGIGIPQGGAFRDRTSGWFVFCNGRAVISADKTPLTGWSNNGLPIFQPKHRPFLGTVYFVSNNPEQLPWNTTKSGINEDSAIWQEAKRHMVSVGRQIVSFLDGRYTDEGTEVASSDLQQAAGPERLNVITAAVPTVRKTFTAPARAPNPNTRIQFDAKSADIKRIAEYLRRPSMTGADVGRHTFNHFLKNEVGEN
jgi:hypothetical protein